MKQINKEPKNSEQSSTVPPFLGMTGFKETKELEDAIKIAENYDFLTCFGMHCSENRLTDSNSYGKRAPRANDLGILLDMIPKNNLKAVHYYSKNTAVYSQVMQLIDYTKTDDILLQLNMSWPQVKDVSKLKEETNLKIILQLPKVALDDLAFYERILDYKTLADYILIDRSGGQGQILDSVYTSKLMTDINKIMPQTIGIAGGISAENVYELSNSIHADYKEPFFVDAESGLRIENHIDMKRILSYMDEYNGFQKTVRG